MTPEQRAELRALADRVEAIQIEPGNVEQEVEGRRLGAEILKALGYREGNRFLYDPAGRLLFRVPDMLNSVDDAMKVVPEGKESGALHAAWAAVSVSHALHVRFWKAELDGSYTQALARAVLVAGLRARADEGEGQ